MKNLKLLVALLALTIGLAGCGKGSSASSSKPEKMLDGDNMIASPSAKQEYTEPEDVTYMRLLAGEDEYRACVLYLGGSYEMTTDVQQVLDSRQGLRELCITDHVDTIHWGTLAPRDDFDWEESWRQFHEAQALWGDRITLRWGAELGEAQLSFDRADRLLAGEELDFVIGSVHLSGKKFANMDLYYIEKGSEAYYDSVIDSYLDDVLALARWGRFQVLGHLTLPLRYINEHHGEHMTFRRHMDRVEEIFRAIIPQGVGIECNTNRGNEPLPGEDILRLYRSLGGEIITLGSDAHRPEDVGCFIRQRQELLRTCGFRYFTTFERGRPLFQAL